MLGGEGGRGAVEPRLGVDDHLDGNAGHHFRIAPLGAKPFAEPRLRQQLLQAQADSARQDHSSRTVGQRIVAAYTSQRSAESIDCRRGQAVLPRDATLPDELVLQFFGGPFLDRSDDELVFLDWLPWSHTFGANHNFNMVLRNGGTLYIDGGKPAPGLFATSLANLKSVMPTVYFNVPRGFDMLIGALREDDALRRRFFTEVKAVFYAGAALPQNLWEALEQMSLQTIGRALPMVSAWGSTETAPLATDCHFQAQRSGNIGVPIPGTDLKLVPSGDKLEVRVRGPNVTPGYWKAPDQTKAAFDEDGFYLIGDAVKFADPARPELGLFFDGRVAEDFKLTSGTWVSVGTLRVNGIAALAPLAQDIVVTGHGGDHVRFLVFPNIAACRALAALTDDASVEDVLGSGTVRMAIANGLAKLKAQSGGSAGHATRALLLTEMPSVDYGEITDKGYVNQRAVIARRRAEVAVLEDDSASARWIACAGL